MVGSFPNWLRKSPGSLKRVAAFRTSFPGLASHSSGHGVALLLAVLLGGGCGRDEIKSYHVPKEQPPREVETSLPAGHSNISAPGPEAGPRLQWNTPDGWKEVPPSEFRVASFQVAGKDGRQADVSVIPLPGSAGGDLSNVNRWRGQVGQKPVSAEELAKLVQAVEVAGQPAALFEQSGENPQGEPTGILAVIYHRDGTAWFFKMSGDRELVAQSKPVFVEFLKSLQFVPARLPPCNGLSAAGACHRGIPTSPAWRPVRHRKQHRATANHGGRCRPAGKKFPADNFSWRSS